jgi:hypothetical protein
VSDTPMDEVTWEKVHAELIAEFGGDILVYSFGSYVSADYARNLKRENRELREALKDYANAINVMCTKNSPILAVLSEMHRTAALKEKP